MRISGFKEAIKLLQGLSPQEAESLILKIAQKDPDMANKLRHSIFAFDDIMFLTTDMITALFKQVDIYQMGIALRGSRPEVAKHIIDNVSKNNRKEIEEIINGPKKPLTEVAKAQKEIMDVIRIMMKKGQIIINRNPEEYV